MTEPPGRRVRRLVALTALLIIAAPATASAQATKTWVSGVGDDSFPCSRTAPCKTFVGAYGKTADGGEINVIDPGGYGTINITRSITIDGNGKHSSILGTGTTGIIINSPTAKVTLRDLAINGARTTSNPGVNGVRVVAARSVRIEDSRIFGFSNAGLLLDPTNANARVVVQRTRIHDNGNYGVHARPGTDPQTAVGGSLRATLSRVRIDDNNNGIVADSLNGASKVRLFDSVVSDSGLSAGTGYGLMTTGSAASIRAGDSRIVGNVQGLYQENFGKLISYGGNIVDDNDTDGLFTDSVARK